MRTHALMVELRERLFGTASPNALDAPTRARADFPQLPCGPAPHDRALLDRLKSATVAQIGVGRAGVRLRTQTLLKFLGDRAVAVEAVRSRLPENFAAQIGAAVTVKTSARDLDEFLLRPDLGRRLPDDELAKVIAACPKNADVQVVVGDGLSANAVAQNAPAFVEALRAECARRGLAVGATVLVERARVKTVDQIGESLGARTAVICVGERPGLGTGDGMSAYMIFGPRAGKFDSDHEVLSNIHPRGIVADEAGRRVATMLQEMIAAGASGVARHAGGAAPAKSEPFCDPRTMRCEPAMARDRVVERHAPPLQTSAAARCAG